MACLGKTTLDLPYEDEPTAGAISDEVRERLGIDDDVTVADHIVCRATVLDAAMGTAKFKLPGVLLDFQVGLTGRAPESVAKVLYMGDEEALAKFGELVRASALGAVRAAR